MNKNIPPLVSMIIPAYNHQQYVVECIDACAAQNYKNKELVIINDGSTDDTHAVIEAYLPKVKDAFTKITYRNKVNSGLSSSLNLALSLAAGEYVLTIASDDYLTDPEALNKLVEKAQTDKAIGLVCADCMIVNDLSERVYWDKKQKSYPSPAKNRVDTFVGRCSSVRPDLDLSNITYKTMLKGNFIANVLLLDRNLIIQLGGYEQGLEDWTMWLKILRNNKIIYIDECMGAYRWHETNSIRNFPVHLAKKTMLFIYGERQYCRENNLYNEWFTQFINQAKRIAKHSEERSELKSTIGFYYYYLSRSKFLRSLHKILK